MINKNEVLKIAQTLNLRPETVEKDYVLNWMLFGINTHLQLKEQWVFKGGTCLKKCFFETFRFSEDLDFTVLKGDHFKEDFLIEVFSNIVDTIYEQIGITFKKENFKFKIFEKSSGKKTAQGKIHFNGPLRRKEKYASIKIDLTNDEVLVLKSQRKEVYYPYSDKPDMNIIANCYTFEEIIAEKIRALTQRARPRDLYDVIHFFRNKTMVLKPKLVCDILRQKCDFKDIAFPTFESIEQHKNIDELKAEWKNMLAHQLPHLPPLEAFWKDLKPFFQWLAGNVRKEKLASINVEHKDIFNPGRIVGKNFIDSILHKIQFATTNRICLKLKYKDKVRTIEPLSFRIAKKTGNKLFYGFHREDKKVKAFIINKIQSVEVTNVPYVEKYLVEIPPIGENTYASSQNY